MESSVLQFTNVNYVVGRAPKEKSILCNVSGTVHCGHVLAIIGPSGAGKTCLIKALTLEQFQGKVTGRMTLNGTPLTSALLKEHCYVVHQKDKHWPYLTCRENLLFVAELFNNRQEEDISPVVDTIIEKMGLTVCTNTRCARLSGGQQRRLSLCAALLHQPKVLYLDEPTTGLDAAAAEKIMKEIVEVAKRDKLIIVCTIHQPSSKVYHGFDQVMVLSKGREAFTGDVKDSIPYLASIGHPLPARTNPAEHFLDLVNSDFSSNEAVDRILDIWAETKQEQKLTNTNIGGTLAGQEGPNMVGHRTANTTNRRYHEIVVMFRRHFRLMIRDPVLYLGRFVAGLIANCVFSIVYINARKHIQEQALNRAFLTIWLSGVAAQMGVAAVYVLNEEFKSILAEAKNGLINPSSYIFAKTFLVIPVMFVFAIFSNGIACYALQDYPPESFGTFMLIWACLMYAFECTAELFSVIVDDPILGMLAFMCVWFGNFLFAGVFLPSRILYWPFEIFYHILPMSYYLRSSLYVITAGTSWDCCFQGTITSQGICVQHVDDNGVHYDCCTEDDDGVDCVCNSTGEDILRGVHLVYGVFEAKNTVVSDICVMLAYAAIMKILYIIFFIRKTNQIATVTL